MFIRPTDKELEGFKPEFTILNASSTNIENWKELGLNSKVFIVLNIKKWTKVEKRSSNFPFGLLGAKSYIKYEQIGRAHV